MGAAGGRGRHTAIGSKPRCLKQKPHRPLLGGAAVAPSTANSTLQTLVDHILPSSSAVFSHATGPRKLSANEQFFVGAQPVVSLLQTIQIISNCLVIFIIFITDHVLTPAQIKSKSFESRRNSFFLFFKPGWMRLIFTCVVGR